jgi:hypothetical protein
VAVTVSALAVIPALRRHLQNKSHLFSFRVSMHPSGSNEESGVVI